MPKEWGREREALRGLTAFLTEECRGGIFGEAIDYAIAATSAHAGAAFTVSPAGPELAAERGLVVRASDAPGPAVPPDPPRLSEIASRVVASRRPLYVPDIAHSELPAELRQSLTRQGFHSLIAAPVKHLREVLGVLLLLTREPVTFEASAASFLEMVVHVVALAAERDRRSEREIGYRDQLIEAGRMASLGLLTATVAHELRGPVAALSLQIEEQGRVIEQLREASRDPLLAAGTTDLSDMLADMTAAVKQISSTIAQLLSVSRRESVPDKLDIGAVAQEAIAMLRPELKRRGIRLSERYGVGCFTSGRRDNLGQVVTNLVLNAADACELSKSDDPRIMVETRVEGSRVVLSIDDTGAGVPPNQVQTIFQPFFTTKGRGKGTGLGLTICSDVVTAHHGHIEVLNGEKGGASFRVVLPRMVGTETESGVHPVAHPSSPRSLPVSLRRVFVVDDDDLFARTIRRALRPHDVRTASMASEAEMTLLDPNYEPHLVLCDLGLPGITGDALHARVKARRPEIAERFVFVTGGACSKQEADYLRSSGCPTLLKPLKIEDVLAALAEPHPPDSVAPEAVATLRSARSKAVDPSEAATIPPEPRQKPNG